MCPVIGAQECVIGRQRGPAVAAGELVRAGVGVVDVAERVVRGDQEILRRARPDGGRELRDDQVIHSRGHDEERGDARDRRRIGIGVLLSDACCAVVEDLEVVAGAGGLESHAERVDARVGRGERVVGRQGG